MDDHSENNGHDSKSVSSVGLTFFFMTTASKNPKNPNNPKNPKVNNNIMIKATSSIMKSKEWWHFRTYPLGISIHYHLSQY